MPDRHVRALRDKLERLLETTRKLESEIAAALKDSSSAQKPVKRLERGVAAGPRKRKRAKA